MKRLVLKPSNHTNFPLGGSIVANALSKQELIAAVKSMAILTKGEKDNSNARAVEVASSFIRSPSQQASPELLGIIKVLNLTFDEDGMDDAVLEAGSKIQSLVILGYMLHCGTRRDLAEVSCSSLNAVDWLLLARCYGCLHILAPALNCILHWDSKLLGRNAEWTDLYLENVSSRALWPSIGMTLDDFVESMCKERPVINKFIELLEQWGSENEERQVRSQLESIPTALYENMIKSVGVTRSRQVVPELVVGKRGPEGGEVIANNEESGLVLLYSHGSPKKAVLLRDVINARARIIVTPDTVSMKKFDQSSMALLDMTKARFMPPFPIDDVFSAMPLLAPAFCILYLNDRTVMIPIGKAPTEHHDGKPPGGMRASATTATDVSANKLKSAHDLKRAIEESAKEKKRLELEAKERAKNQAVSSKKKKVVSSDDEEGDDTDANGAANPLEMIRAENERKAEEELKKMRDELTKLEAINWPLRQDRKDPYYIETQDRIALLRSRIERAEEDDGDIVGDDDEEEDEEDDYSVDEELELPDMTEREQRYYDHLHTEKERRDLLARVKKRNAKYDIEEYESHQLVTRDELVALRKRTPKQSDADNANRHSDNVSSKKDGKVVLLPKEKSSAGQRKIDFDASNDDDDPEDFKQPSGKGLNRRRLRKRSEITYEDDELGPHGAEEADDEHEAFMPKKKRRKLTEDDDHSQSEDYADDSSGDEDDGEGEEEEEDEDEEEDSDEPVSRKSKAGNPIELILTMRSDFIYKLTPTYYIKPSPLFFAIKHLLLISKTYEKASSDGKDYAGDWQEVSTSEEVSDFIKKHCNKIDKLLLVKFFHAMIKKMPTNANSHDCAQLLFNGDFTLTPNLSYFSIVMKYIEELKTKLVGSELDRLDSNKNVFNRSGTSTLDYLQMFKEDDCLQEIVRFFALSFKIQEM